MPPTLDEYIQMGGTADTWEMIYNAPFVPSPSAASAIDEFGGFAKKRTRTSPFNEPKEDDMTVLPAMDGFTFGCDPELFVKNDKGEFVSAAGYIPGTKEEPYKVDGGAVQLDGMAAEFNIDPVTTFADFNRNIDKVMKSLEGFLPKGFTLEAVPAVTFDQEEFDKAPDDAKVLGCMPDFNAWTGGINNPPNDPDNPYMRCAAGHMHYGWTDGAEMDDVQHILNCRDLVKQLDWYLGGWSLKTDSDPTRRRLYGKAGACRYKGYGVEYRVLSNFWVTTRERRLAVWNRSQLAIGAIANGFIPDRINGAYNELLQQSINETKLDEQLARNMRFPLTTTDSNYASF